MQGHDGKPSIQCVCKETKNESSVVTCFLQKERESIKDFLGCVCDRMEKQDGE